MTEHHGRFCWYELMTTDVDAAADFYGKVIGWTFGEGPTASSAPGETPYRVLIAGQTGTGGIIAIRPEALANGARPIWMGYIAVDDVDACANLVVANGGGVHMGPAEIPAVGRFAVVTDPHGAFFQLFKPGMDGPALPSASPEPGMFTWRELMAGNGEEAMAFYAKMFGWGEGLGHAMGEMGVYQLFNDGQTPDDLGGMMTRPPHIPVPIWNYYINVDSAEAGAARCKAAGGAVLNGPMRTPGDNWIVQAMDPQGALFCMTSLTP